MLALLKRAAACAALLAAGLAALPGAGRAGAADVVTAPAPAWVLPPPAATAPAAANGSARSLEVWDTQILADGPRTERYEYRALRIHRPEALKDVGVVAVEFAPDFQHLEFHILRIVREERSIDLLPEARFRVVNRERQLAESVVTGRVAATAQIPDLRVGDRLEYAYRVVGANPVFGEAVAFSVPFDAPEPLALRRVRLLDKSGRPTHFRLLSPRGAEALDVQRSSVAGGFETLVAAERVRPVRFEAAMPPGYQPWISLHFSSYDSWGAVARWADGIFAPEVRSERALAELAERLRKLPDRRAAIDEAVRFVQDEVRYFSVAIGENSHRPQPPDIVLERRYGDCKDKALLLTRLLERIGVEAVPVLVSTGMRGEIERAGPTPAVFDHAIVRVRYGGRDYWIDATRPSGRVPFDKQATLFAGAKVLPVARRTAALESVPQEAKSIVATREAVELPSPEAPADYRIETSLAGAAAEHYRDYQRLTPAPELSRRSLETFSRRFNNSSAVEQAVVSDQRDTGGLVLREHYSAPQLFRSIDTNRRVAVFGGRNLLFWLQANLQPFRQHPYAIPGARGEYSYDLTVHFAEGVSAREDPITDRLDTPQFTLETRRSFRGDTFRFHAALQVKAESVAPTAVAQYLEAVKHAEAKLFDVLPLTPDTLVARAGGTAKPYGQRLKEQLQGRVEALTRAIASNRLGDEEAAAAYIERGLSLSSLDDHAGALRDLNAALRLRPNEPRAYAGRGSAYLRGGSLRLAEADYTQALTLAAEPSFTYMRRGHARYMAGRYAEALEDFDRAARANETGLNREFIEIWQRLAALRAGQPAKAAAEVKPRIEGDWPNGVLRLLAGRASVDDVLKEAASGTTDEQLANLCEAYFYLGQIAAAKGDKAGAETWFRKSLDTGVLHYMEFELAQLSLNGPK